MDATQGGGVVEDYPDGERGSADLLFVPKIS